jgi:hypothetical protein
MGNDRVGNRIEMGWDWKARRARDWKQRKLGVARLAGIQKGQDEGGNVSGRVPSHMDSDGTSTFAWCCMFASNTIVILRHQLRIPPPRRCYFNPPEIKSRKTVVCTCTGSLSVSSLINSAPPAIGWWCK